MKSPFKHLILLFLCTLVLFSCTVEKRLYNKGYSVEWKNNSLAEKESVIEKHDVASVSDEVQDLQLLEEELELSQEESASGLLEEKLCDSIVMRNGDIKVGTVTEISATEVRYKNCDISGPIYVLQKENVMSIGYADGKKEIYVKDEPAVVKTAQAAEPQFEGFGFFGFLASIIGIFFAGIPMGILAMVFGAISIGRTVSHPIKYTGKAFGALALIFGFVILILTLIVLL